MENLVGRNPHATSWLEKPSFFRLFSTKELKPTESPIYYWLPASCQQVEASQHLAGVGGLSLRLVMPLTSAKMFNELWRNYCTAIKNHACLLSCHLEKADHPESTSYNCRRAASTWLNKIER